MWDGVTNLNKNYKLNCPINKCLVTQSKSKTTITRSVHCEFNCITVKYNGTRHGIYIKNIK